MVAKAGTTTTVAKAISNLFHPYIVLTLLVVFVAYDVSTSFIFWAKWTMIALLSAYCLPIIYTRLKFAASPRITDAASQSRSIPRNNPNEMLILAALFGIPSVLILYCFGSPLEIIAIILGVGASSIIIALVNRTYRASFHLATFTSVSISSIIIAGLYPIVPVLLIILLGASRYFLGQHTPLQLVTGFFIGLIITGAILLGFGFLG